MTQPEQSEPRGGLVEQIVSTLGAGGASPDPVQPVVALGEHFGLSEEQVRAGVEEIRHRVGPQPVQRPALSRMVHVLVHPTLNGGADVATGVVTRVHGQAHDGSWDVNVRLLLDGTNRSHEWATHVHLYATEEDARREWVELTARLDGFEAEHRVGVSGFAFWPARS